MPTTFEDIWENQYVWIWYTKVQYETHPMDFNPLTELLLCALVCSDKGQKSE